MNKNKSEQITCYKQSIISKTNPQNYSQVKIHGKGNSVDIHMKVDKVTINRGAVSSISIAQQLESIIKKSRDYIPRNFNRN